MGERKAEEKGMAYAFVIAEPLEQRARFVGLRKLGDHLDAVKGVFVISDGTDGLVQLELDMKCDFRYSVYLSKQHFHNPTSLYQNSPWILW